MFAEPSATALSLCFNKFCWTFSGWRELVQSKLLCLFNWMIYWLNDKMISFAVYVSKQTNLSIKLSIPFSADQLLFFFSCQWSKLVTGQSFFLVRGTTLDMYCYPAASRNVLRCWSKLLSKPNEAHNIWEDPRVQLLVLLLMQNHHPVLVKLGAIAASMLTSAAATIQARIPFFLFALFFRGLQSPTAFVTAQRTVIGSSILTPAGNTLDWSFSRWMTVKPWNRSCLARSETGTERGERERKLPKQRGFCIAFPSLPLWSCIYSASHQLR